MQDSVDPRALGLYYEARRRAVREDLLARLRGESDNLIPYEAVATIVRAHEHAARPELRPIPLAQIVGSVGRYRDFTRTFMPREAISQDRWVKIESALGTLEGVPPIEVYQIGDVYFVADGNHRVSVAQANGFKEIDAYVTEVPVEVDLCLEPGDTVDQAIMKAECARFVSETGLAGQCEELAIRFSRPGGFLRLLDHVEVHRYFMVLDCPDLEEPTYQEAARDWYDNVYQPIVAAIERQGLLERFPGTTASDLYVWVSGRILELHKLFGQDVEPDEAASLVRQEGPLPVTPFHRAVLSVIGRLASSAVGAMTLEGSEGLPSTALVPDTLMVAGPVLAPIGVVTGYGTIEAAGAPGQQDPGPLSVTDGKEHIDE